MRLFAIAILAILPAYCRCGEPPELAVVQPPIPQLRKSEEQVAPRRKTFEEKEQEVLKSPRTERVIIAGHSFEVEVTSDSVVVRHPLSPDRVSEDSYSHSEVPASIRRALVLKVYGDPELDDFLQTASDGKYVFEYRPGTESAARLSVILGNKVLVQEKKSSRLMHFKDLDPSMQDWLLDAIKQKARNTAGGGGGMTPPPEFETYAVLSLETSSRIKVHSDGGMEKEVAEATRSATLEFATDQALRSETDIFTELVPMELPRYSDLELDLLDSDDLKELAERVAREGDDTGTSAVLQPPLPALTARERAAAEDGSEPEQDPEMALFHSCLLLAGAHIHVPIDSALGGSRWFAKSPLAARRIVKVLHLATVLQTDETWARVDINDPAANHLDTVNAIVDTLSLPGPRCEALSTHQSRVTALKWWARETLRRMVAVPVNEYSPRTTKEARAIQQFRERDINEFLASLEVDTRDPSDPSYKLSLQQVSGPLARTAVMQACRSHDEALLERLLLSPFHQATVAFGLRDLNGDTAEHLCIRYGNDAMLAAVLKHSAQATFERFNSAILTPLAATCRFGSSASTEMVLAAMTDPKSRLAALKRTSARGENALQLCLVYGNGDGADALLKAMHSVGIRVRSGEANVPDPLVYACTYASQRSVESTSRALANEAGGRAPVLGNAGVACGVWNSESAFRRVVGLQPIMPKMGASADEIESERSLVVRMIGLTPDVLSCLRHPSLSPFRAPWFSTLSYQVSFFETGRKTLSGSLLPGTVYDGDNALAVCAREGNFNMFTAISEHASRESLSIVVHGHYATDQRVPLVVLIATAPWQQEPEAGTTLEAIGRLFATHKVANTKDIAMRLYAESIVRDLPSLAEMASRIGTAATDTFVDPTSVADAQSHPLVAAAMFDCTPSRVQSVVNTVAKWVEGDTHTSLESLLRPRLSQDERSSATRLPAIAEACATKQNNTMGLVAALMLQSLQEEPLESSSAIRDVFGSNHLGLSGILERPACGGGEVEHFAGICRVTCGVGTMPSYAGVFDTSRSTCFYPSGALAYCECVSRPRLAGGRPDREREASLRILHDSVKDFVQQLRGIGLASLAFPPSIRFAVSADSSDASGKVPTLSQGQVAGLSFARAALHVQLLDRAFLKDPHSGIINHPTPAIASMGVRSDAGATLTTSGAPVRRKLSEEPNKRVEDAELAVLLASGSAMTYAFASPEHALDESMHGTISRLFSMADVLPLHPGALGFPGVNTLHLLESQSGSAHHREDVLAISPPDLGGKGRMRGRIVRDTVRGRPAMGGMLDEVTVRSSTLFGEPAIVPGEQPRVPCDLVSDPSDGSSFLSSTSGDMRGIVMETSTELQAKHINGTGHSAFRATAAYGSILRFTDDVLEAKEQAAKVFKNDPSGRENRYIAAETLLDRSRGSSSEELRVAMENVDMLAKTVETNVDFDELRKINEELDELRARADDDDAVSAAPQPKGKSAKPSSTDGSIVVAPVSEDIDSQAVKESFAKATARREENQVVRIVMSLYSTAGTFGRVRSDKYHPGYDVELLEAGKGSTGKHTLVRSELLEHVERLEHLTAHVNVARRSHLRTRTDPAKETAISHRLPFSSAGSSLATQLNIVTDRATAMVCKLKLRKPGGKTVCEQEPVPLPLDGTPSDSDGPETSLGDALGITEYISTLKDDIPEIMVNFTITEASQARETNVVEWNPYNTALDELLHMPPVPRSRVELARAELQTQQLTVIEGVGSCEDAMAHVFPKEDAGRSEVEGAGGSEVASAADALSMSDVTCTPIDCCGPRWMFFPHLRTYILVRKSLLKIATTVSKSRTVAFDAFAALDLAWTHALSSLTALTVPHISKLVLDFSPTEHRSSPEIQLFHAPSHSAVQLYPIKLSTSDQFILALDSESLQLVVSSPLALACAKTDRQACQPAPLESVRTLLRHLPVLSDDHKDDVELPVPRFAVHYPAARLVESEDGDTRELSVQTDFAGEDPSVAATTVLEHFMKRSAVVVDRSPAAEAAILAAFLQDPWADTHAMKASISSLYVCLDDPTPSWVASFDQLLSCREFTTDASPSVLPFPCDTKTAMAFFAALEASPPTGLRTPSARSPVATVPSTAPVPPPSAPLFSGTMPFVLSPEGLDFSMSFDVKSSTMIRHIFASALRGFSLDNLVSLSSETVSQFAAAAVGLIHRKGGSGKAAAGTLSAEEDELFATIASFYGKLRFRATPEYGSDTSSGRFGVGVLPLRSKLTVGDWIEDSQRGSREQVPRRIVVNRAAFGADAAQSRVRGHAGGATPCSPPSVDMDPTDFEFAEVFTPGDPEFVSRSNSGWRSGACLPKLTAGVLAHAAQHSVLVRARNALYFPDPITRDTVHVMRAFPTVMELAVPCVRGKEVSVEIESKHLPDIDGRTTTVHISEECTYAGVLLRVFEQLRIGTVGVQASTLTAPAVPTSSLLSFVTEKDTSASSWKLSIGEVDQIDAGRFLQSKSPVSSDELEAEIETAERVRWADEPEVVLESDPERMKLGEPSFDTEATLPVFAIRGDFVVKVGMLPTASTPVANLIRSAVALGETQAELAPNYVLAMSGEHDSPTRAHLSDLLKAARVAPLVGGLTTLSELTAPGGVTGLVAVRLGACALLPGTPSADVDLLCEKAAHDRDCVVGTFHNTKTCMTPAFGAVLKKWLGDAFSIRQVDQQHREAGGKLKRIELVLDGGAAAGEERQVFTLHTFKDFNPDEYRTLGSIEEELDTLRAGAFAEAVVPSALCIDPEGTVPFVGESLYLDTYLPEDDGVLRIRECRADDGTELHHLCNTARAAGVCAPGCLSISLQRGWRKDVGCAPPSTDIEALRARLLPTTKVESKTFTSGEGTSKPSSDIDIGPEPSTATDSMSVLDVTILSLDGTSVNVELVLPSRVTAKAVVQLLARRGQIEMGWDNKLYETIASQGYLQSHVNELPIPGGIQLRSLPTLGGKSRALLNLASATEESVGASCARSKRSASHPLTCENSACDLVLLVQHEAPVDTKLRAPSNSIGYACVPGAHRIESSFPVSIVGEDLRVYNDDRETRAALRKLQSVLDIGLDFVHVYMMRRLYGSRLTYERSISGATPNVTPARTPLIAPATEHPKSITRHRNQREDARRLREETEKAPATSQWKGFFSWFAASSMPASSMSASSMPFLLELGEGMGSVALKDAMTTFIVSQRDPISSVLVSFEQRIATSAIVVSERSEKTPLTVQFDALLDAIPESFLGMPRSKAAFFIDVGADNGGECHRFSPIPTSSAPKPSSAASRVLREVVQASLRSHDDQPKLRIRVFEAVHAAGIPGSADPRLRHCLESWRSDLSTRSELVPVPFVELLGEPVPGGVAANEVIASDEMTFDDLSASVRPAIEISAKEVDCPKPASPRVPREGGALICQVGWLAGMPEAVVVEQACERARTCRTGWTSSEVAAKQLVSLVKSFHGFAVDPSQIHVSTRKHPKADPDQCSVTPYVHSGMPALEDKHDCYAVSIEGDVKLPHTFSTVLSMYSCESAEGGRRFSCPYSSALWKAIGLPPKPRVELNTFLRQVYADHRDALIGKTFGLMVPVQCPARAEGPRGLMGRLKDSVLQRAQPGDACASPIGTDERLLGSSSMCCDMRRALPHADWSRPVTGIVRVMQSKSEVFYTVRDTLVRVSARVRTRRPGQCTFVPLVERAVYHVGASSQLGLIAEQGMRSLADTLLMRSLLGPKVQQKRLDLVQPGSELPEEVETDLLDGLKQEELGLRLVNIDENIDRTLQSLQRSPRASLSLDFVTEAFDKCAEREHLKQVQHANAHLSAWRWYRQGHMLWVKALELGHENDVSVKASPAKTCIALVQSGHGRESCVASGTLHAVGDKVWVRAPPNMDTPIPGVVDSVHEQAVEADHGQVGAETVYSVRVTEDDRTRVISDVRPKTPDGWLGADEIDGNAVAVLYRRYEKGDLVALERPGSSEGPYLVSTGIVSDTPSPGKVVVSLTEYPRSDPSRDSKIADGTAGKTFPEDKLHPVLCEVPRDRLVSAMEGAPHPLLSMLRDGAPIAARPWRTPSKVKDSVTSGAEVTWGTGTSPSAWVVGTAQLAASGVQIALFGASVLVEKGGPRLPGSPKTPPQWRPVSQKTPPVRLVGEAMCIQPLLSQDVDWDGTDHVSTIRDARVLLNHAHPRAGGREASVFVVQTDKSVRLRQPALARIPVYMTAKYLLTVNSAVFSTAKGDTEFTKHQKAIEKAEAEKWKSTVIDMSPLALNSYAIQGTGILLTRNVKSDFQAHHLGSLSEVIIRSEFIGATEKEEVERPKGSADSTPGDAAEPGRRAEDGQTAASPSPSPSGIAGVRRLLRLARRSVPSLTALDEVALALGQDAEKVGDLPEAFIEAAARVFAGKPTTKPAGMVSRVVGSKGFDLGVPSSLPSSGKFGSDTVGLTLRAGITSDALEETAETSGDPKAGGAKPKVAGHRQFFHTECSVSVFGFKFTVFDLKAQALSHPSRGVTYGYEAIVAGEPHSTSAPMGTPAATVEFATAEDLARSFADLSQLARLTLEEAVGVPAVASSSSPRATQADPLVALAAVQAVAQRKLELIDGKTWLPQSEIEEGIESDPAWKSLGKCPGASDAIFAAEATGIEMWRLSKSSPWLAQAKDFAQRVGSALTSRKGSGKKPSVGFMSMTIPLTSVSPVSLSLSVKLRGDMSIGLRTHGCVKDVPSDLKEANILLRRPTIAQHGVAIVPGLSVSLFPSLDLGIPYVGTAVSVAGRVDLLRIDLAVGHTVRTVPVPFQFEVGKEASSIFKPGTLSTAANQRPIGGCGTADLSLSALSGEIMLKVVMMKTKSLFSWNGISSKLATFCSGSFAMHGMKLGSCCMESAGVLGDASLESTLEAAQQARERLIREQREREEEAAEKERRKREEEEQKREDARRKEEAVKQEEAQKAKIKAEKEALLARQGDRVRKGSEWEKLTEKQVREQTDAIVHVAVKWASATVGEELVEVPATITVHAPGIAALPGFAVHQIHASLSVTSALASAPTEQTPLKLSWTAEGEVLITDEESSTPLVLPPLSVVMDGEPEQSGEWTVMLKYPVSFVDNEILHYLFLKPTGWVDFRDVSESKEDLESPGLQVVETDIAGYFRRRSKESRVATRRINYVKADPETTRAWFVGRSSTSGGVINTFVESCKNAANRFLCFTSQNWFRFPSKRSAELKFEEDGASIRLIVQAKDASGTWEVRTLPKRTWASWLANMVTMGADQLELVSDGDYVRFTPVPEEAYVGPLLRLMRYHLKCPNGNLIEVNDSEVLTCNGDGSTVVFRIK